MDAAGENSMQRQLPLLEFAPTNRNYIRLFLFCMRVNLFRLIEQVLDRVIRNAMIISLGFFKYAFCFCSHPIFNKGFIKRCEKFPSSYFNQEGPDRWKNFLSITLFNGEEIPNFFDFAISRFCKSKSVVQIHHLSSGKTVR